MGSMEEHLEGNTTLITSLRYQLKDLWRSPRGTVLRIEALALVAITLSFFLAFFGSCRRWSNRWIVQKGFLAAQVLSLSLGTYSIGLMQSSPMKSGMYPIWAASLLTLFGCVDPVTTYIGLDYKGPISRMIFQLCLYFGYVMLMSVSTISSDVGKLAIVLLSTITFMKGFHRALAFVLHGHIRDAYDFLDAVEPAALAGDGYGMRLIVHLTDDIAMGDIQELRLPEGTTANGLGIKDVCLSYSFSHLLRQHFLGLGSAWRMEKKLMIFERLVQKIDYERALKVVEVELAFLFEAFFTSNEFLHLYQAKTGSFWALASFVGICFVGVVVAIIPGAMASHHSIINSAAAATGSSGAGTSVGVNIVSTTTADLIITLDILVSLALLQLVQLMWCLTSNWARVGIACDDVEVTMGDGFNDYPQRHYKKESCRCSNTRRMRLFLVDRVNYFDKYLWQDRLGQDSLAAVVQRRRTQYRRASVLAKACCCNFFPETFLRWLSAVGVEYICAVVRALLLSDTTNPGGAVSLHDDVKASISEFLGTIKSRRIGVEWSDLFLKNGLQDWLEYLPYTNTCCVPVGLRGDESEAYAFTWRVMIWHIATWYCEEADNKAAGGNIGGGGGEGGGSSSSSRKKNRRVAMDLSKYCVYMVVSAPELLPGPAMETKKALDTAIEGKPQLEVLQLVPWSELPLEFMTGVYLGKRLRNEAMKAPPTRPAGRPGPTRRWEEGEQGARRPCSTDLWELLALLWVQTFLYAAPYGDVQAHMQRLAQGGEFITHIWALLYHLGIDKWEVAGIDELKGGAAAGTTTTTTAAEAQVQEAAATVSGPEIQEISS